jgi:predicted ATPase
MISLFARLYLYPKKKILLIDEPELSLSIDWQRKILVDIVSAQSCQQIIAITHSPFVFDNALEPFATPLKLRIDASTPNEAIIGDDEDEAHDE